MKKSKYNYTTQSNGKSVLYNSLSDEVAILDLSIGDLYERSTSDEIRQRHPDFYHFLVEKSFIIDEQCDETAMCISKWQEEDGAQTAFSITINPTLDCNMRCWYCYEKHDHTRTMSATVLGRVKKLISSKISCPELERLNISFFGGEPLIQFKNIVRPILEFAVQQSREANKLLSVGFVTNGYLITDEIITYLKSLNCQLNFQITLDGNQSAHDATRCTVAKKGSYLKILKNIALILQYGKTDVTLRLNYTSKKS
jgi:uncharacterized protein